MVLIVSLFYDFRLQEVATMRTDIWTDLCLLHVPSPHVDPLY
jgi:hypothetical protein